MFGKPIGRSKSLWYNGLRSAQIGQEWVLFAMSDDFNTDESVEEASGTDRGDIHEALGQSDAFLNFQEHLSRAAQVNRPVLLLGERGTGKELAATRIHYLSPRWEGPFIALNCSALSATLIESELFGHEAGSFTGARSRRTGRFEAANNGTLFLDEIGNIPLEVQEKILRVVEYGAFERVGSSKPIQVDVRIVGASNADLRAMSDQGTFMRDLLDRLSFDVLVLPPLRERLDDIPLLANHFASRMAFELGWVDVPEIADETLDLLRSFAWPGNVRELKNVIERAVYRSADNTISRDEIVFDPFSEFGDGGAVLAPPGESAQVSLEPEQALTIRTHEGAALQPFAEAMRDVELRLLKQALKEAKFNQRKAAELLELTYHQFRGLYRKYQDEVNSE